MKTVTFTDAQFAMMKQAVSNHFDIVNDMATDELFYRVKDIRTLAEQSDEGIQAELTRRSAAVNAEIDRVVILNELMNKLDD